MLMSMATLVTRTPDDDLVDAAHALRAARAEFSNWTAHCEHLLRVDLDDAPGIVFQARRSARIVQALLDEAETLSMSAVMRP